MTFPKHGRIDCSICFNDNRPTKYVEDWKINNDPGAWGSHNPEVLILGFSKGSTQAEIYESGDFEDVPFAGCRDRLTKVLKAVGILNEEEHIDEKISKNEKRIALGSLVRCSLTRKNSKTGNYETSGSLINKSFKEIPEIVGNCTTEFLKELPLSIKVVVLLGVDRNYIKNCKELFKETLDRNLIAVNDVSYKVNGKLFIHLAHPSPANGHLNSWLKDVNKYKDIRTLINEEK